MVVTATTYARAYGVTVREAQYRLRALFGVADARTRRVVTINDLARRCHVEPDDLAALFAGAA